MTCVRVAAVADVHVGLDSDPVLAVERLAETADMLLVAGDLTRHGTPEEAEVLAVEVALMPVPVVIVLGDHDYESDAADRVRPPCRGRGPRCSTATRSWCPSTTCGSASPARPGSAGASAAPAVRSSASR
jgi:predicted phosphodiesterase